eukprot:jgi/Picsp_1/2752/NSC_00980-R1_protein
MYVPSDSFGGVSPERKSAEMMNTFFTFAAVKIVLAQLEGSSSGRGTTAGAYNPGGYKVLDTFLREYPLKNISPDVWLGKLMKTDKMIALRIMEVRKAYASGDFEWDNLQRLSLEMLQDENLAVMRKHVI